jgi:uncharacterized protein YkwD
VSASASSTIIGIFPDQPMILRRSILVLALGCLAATAGCIVQYQVPVARGDASPDTRQAADSVAAVRERELAGILTTHPGQRHPRLAPNAILARVARERARDMAARGYFAHVTPEGLGANTLVERAGYALPAAYDHRLAGNNIESAAEGHATAESAWRNWMGSPHHRAHLLGLEPQFRPQREFGIGYARRPGGAAYWVVLIAEPGTR